VDRDAGAAAPRAAQRDGLAELVGGGEQQVFVQAAEQDAVRADHVDEAGEAEAEVLDEGVCGLVHLGVGVVAGREHGDGLVKHGDVRGRHPVRRGQEALGVGLHVQAAAVAAGTGAAVRVDADVPGLHGQPATSGVQRAAQHERAADAAVLGRDDQQVGRAAACAVPVFRQRERVDVVDDRARAADVLVGQQAAEHVADLRAGRPAEVQRADRGAFRFRDSGGHHEGRADAATAGLPEQPGAGLRERCQRPRRVIGGGHLAARPGDDPAAESDQRDREAIGVELRGEGHRAVRVDRQAVGGPALGTAARSGLDEDQAQVAELAGDGAGRGPGDAKRRGERGPGGRLPGVDQRERCPGQAAPVVPGVRGPGLPGVARQARHR
jgi:hypothetical protein